MAGWVKTIQESWWTTISMTTEVARASETYRKTPNTFSFQYQSTVLLIPTPVTVSRTSLPTNQTGNRQITLAGTTREPRAYLLTLPGPLPAPASELRAGRWVKVGDRGSRPQPGSGRAVTRRDRRRKAGHRHRAA